MADMVNSADIDSLILLLIPAIVEGLWDARDSGEEVSEIKPFIDRDAEVVVTHIRKALMKNAVTGLSP